MGPGPCGHAAVTQSDIIALKELAGKAKSWIIFLDGHEETALELAAWENKFRVDTGRDATLLKGWMNTAAKERKKSCKRLFGSI